MAGLKPVYLIHGDDHGAVGERRAGLKALAESGSGGMGSVEILEGDAAGRRGGRGAGRDDPQRRAKSADRRRGRALASGRRRVAAGAVPGGDGARDDARIFAREDARAKAPAALHEAVKKAGA